MNVDPIWLGRLHDGFCRCPGCKPGPQPVAVVEPAGAGRITGADVAFAFLSVVALLVMAGTGVA